MVNIICLLLLLIMEQVRGEKSIVVVRSGAHSGSNWFAQLLAARGIATFFQFYGECGSSRHEILEERLALLYTLLETGCNCSSIAWERPMSCNDATRERKKCRQLPFCTGKCREASPVTTIKKCNGVAVVGQPFMIGGFVHGAFEYQQVVNALFMRHYNKEKPAAIIDGMRSSHKLQISTWTQHQLLPHLNHKRLVIISWERNNIVKQAVSQLKSPCPHPSFRNHARPKHRFLWKNFTSFIYVSPNTLLRRALKLTIDLHVFHEFLLALPSNIMVHRCHYEQFQHNADTELNILFKKLQLPKWTLNKKAQDQAKTLKSSTDSLIHYILNFSNIFAYFEYHWPCALQQLNSTSPHSFQPCPILPNLPSFLPLHQHHDVKKPRRVLDCLNHLACDTSRACSSLTSSGIPQLLTQSELSICSLATTSSQQREQETYSFPANSSIKLSIEGHLSSQPLVCVVAS